MVADYWKQFLEKTVRSGKRGVVEDIDEGVRCAWGDCALPITNGYYVTTPLEGRADLARRIQSARADLPKRSAMPWLFYVPSDLLNGLSFDDVDGAGAERGLAPFMNVREMTAEVPALRPPRRPLPELEYERVASTEGAREVLRVNVEAYGMPLEIIESSLESEMFLAGKMRECGLLARVNGEAVSTATVIDLDGLLYVALVATAVNHRQRGYAEAVMRRALETGAREFGLTRTALDASAMGEPVYAAMGYQATGTDWRILTEAPAA
jgi:hypothetical protein